MYILEFTTMDAKLSYRISFLEKSWAIKCLNYYQKCINNNQYSGNRVIHIETDNPYDYPYVIPLEPMFACIHKQ